MPLRAIIIDDDEVGIEALKLLISKFIDDVNVVAESSDPSHAVKLIQDYSPEIVFLDIMMPGMDGFELLEKLGTKNFKLIFTTAHHEHALRALKIDAHDYLLKPVDYRELRCAVDRVRRNLLQDAHKKTGYEIPDLSHLFHKTKLAINTKSGVESIDYTDIVSFESMSNYSKIYLCNAATLTTPKTLKEFETQLCNKKSNFMRVHNSYMINLEKVTRYLKEEECIIMVNDQKIPVAKSRKELFFKWLTL